MIRQPLGDQPADSHSLSVIQPTTSRQAASLARSQRPQAAVARQLHPFAYCSQAHPVGFRRRSLRHAVTHGLHHHFSQVRLRGAVQFAGISFRLHAHKRTTHYLVHSSVTDSPPRYLHQSHKISLFENSE
ncbi:hypothetical protein QFZ96_002396 [Paraburkholderia youngii]